MALALFALMSMAFSAAAAQADTGNIIEPQNNPPTNGDGWQAGTCLTNEPAPGVKCGPQTGGAFFKTAAGHPPVGFTQYIIQHEAIEPLPSPPFPAGSVKAPIKDPLANREIKTLRVDLPPGLTVNPNATAKKCSLTEFLHSPAPGEFKPECSEETKVGEEEVTLVTNEVGAEVPGIGPIPVKGFVIPPTPTVTKVNVYNLEPKAGEPALFAFVVADREPVFLETEVAWDSDFHEAFTIHLPEAEVPGLSTLISRLVNFGNKETDGADGTYINNPTTCFDPSEAANEHLYSTWFRAESYGEPNPNFPNGSTAVESKVVENAGGVAKPVQQTGCDGVPFSPGIDVNPNTPDVDSPAPATVDTTLKYFTGAENPQQSSHLRKAVVKMPEGMGLNPSGSNGLVACSDAQFKKGQRTYDNECPADSKVGTATIESPPLSSPLVGDIYVGEQKSSNPESGEEFRILVEAKDQNQGIDVRLVGNVAANKETGQMTATFNEQEIGEFAGKLPEGLPQVPFTSVKLKFDGSRSVLTSPPTCSEAETSAALEPWARPGTTTTVTSKFSLSSIPGGGSCPKTLGERPFAPSYTAATESTKARIYSPFKVTIGRPDGQQEIKAVNVTLPKGLTGKLAGIPYCSDQALSAAAGVSGKSEQQNPSCANESQIGTTSTTAGTGDKPVTLGGKAYLAGPYKGAPLSMAIITPAVSGPFDLGTVVVRVALNVNPETAQVNAVSDAIPDVFGGVKLDLRSIVVDVNRQKFMKNPTNCAAQATAGFINGGGSNPLSSGSWSSYAVSAPFQATGCSSLSFKPKLHTRISGPTTRAKNPKIRAVLEARENDANIARTALTLPHSLFLDQSHIKTVCTRPQLASMTCPKASQYGYAKAKTPLLSNQLKGPVYLVSSNHKLPDLVADLRGQVRIQLHGVISSKHGGLKTVFNPVPDVPVKKFILEMQGGKKSLIVNSTNLCKTKRTAVLNIKGQNGKAVKNNKYRLNVTGCKGKKKK
jgi:hypothetical protein